MRQIRWDMRLTDERIIEFLSHLTEPMSQEHIAAALGCHPKTVYNSIRRLSDVITLVGTGGRTPNRYIIRMDELPAHLQEAINRKS